MPFSSNAQLPKGVKNLPEHAQSIWRMAYNSALEEYGEEDRAARIAWGAVKKSYHQTKEGRWVANDSGPAGGNGNGNGDDDDDDDDDDNDNDKKESVPQPEPRLRSAKRSPRREKFNTYRFADHKEKSHRPSHARDPRERRDDEDRRRDADGENEPAESSRSWRAFVRLGLGDHAACKEPCDPSGLRWNLQRKRPRSRQRQVAGVGLLHQRRDKSEQLLFLGAVSTSD